MEALERFNNLPTQQRRKTWTWQPRSRVFLGTELCYLSQVVAHVSISRKEAVWKAPCLLAAGLFLSLRPAWLQNTCLDLPFQTVICSWTVEITRYKHLKRNIGKSYPKEFNICNVKTISQNKHQNFCLSILKFRVSFLKKKKVGHLFISILLIWN